MAEENIDLDPARQQEILALEARISTTNHFEVLGVPAGASPEEAKKAFHELSRKFHPDRYYGKNLGSFRPKLDKIFRRLVEAHQVLTDLEKREAFLAANPFVRAAVRATGSGVQAAPAAKTEEQLAREKERAERFKRHPYLARATKVHELMSKAREHIAKKEYSHAFTNLNLATQMDPSNEEVKTLHAEVRKSYDLMRSDTDYKRGVDALERMDTHLALQAFKAAVAANGQHHQAAFQVAQLMERNGEDAKEVTGYLQKAVEADPKNVTYRLELARLLDAAGMKALAKKHVEEAAKLDPEHPEVKKSLKKRWPF